MKAILTERHLNTNREINIVYENIINLEDLKLLLWAAFEKSENEDKKIILSFERNFIFKGYLYD